jgi:PAS domain S-box-containing protein
MRISFKLVASYWALATLVSVIGFFSGRTNREIESQVQELGRVSLVQAVDGSDIMLELHAAQLLVADALLHQDSVDEHLLLRVRGHIQAARRSLDRSVQIQQGGEFLSGSAQDFPLVDPDRMRQIESAFNEQQRKIHGVLTLLKDGNLEAAVGAFDAMNDHFENVLSPRVRDYRHQGESRATTQVNRIERAIAEANRRHLATTLLAMASAVALGGVMSRSIGGPLGILRNAAEAIGRGRLETRVTIRSRDELSVLAAAFNQMAAEIEAKTVSKAFVDNIFHAMREMLIVVRLDGEIQLANQATARELRTTTAALRGRRLSELLPSWTPAPHSLDADALAGAGEGEMVTADQETIPVYYSVGILRDGEGRAEALVCLAQNISARKAVEQRLQASLAEKDLLLREIHHRVKNNLQVISSLLQLQANYADDPTLSQLLGESQHRIRSMALIHEQLCRGDNLQNIDFAAYARDLCARLRQAVRGDAVGVRITTDLEEVSLPIAVAMPCGMIVNELVYNALEHAFPEGRGEVRVGYHIGGDGRHRLSVSDDGVGMEPADSPTPGSLGLQLVSGLVRQLGGEMQVTRSGGVAIQVVFRPERDAQA